jgi:predicted GNAT family acetyltransferase
VRRLAHDREVAISAVRSSCSGTEWEHGGIAVGASEVWASFEGAQVVALGQLRSHTGGAVDPCVITHSAYRGRGHASRVVSAMAAEALSGGRVVLYQTLLSNRPAMSLAMRLGFEHYATLLAVRLRPGAG